MKLFFSFTLQQFSLVSMYRFEFFAEMGGSMVQMLGVYWLWSTLAIQKPEMLGISLPQMLTYALLATVVAAFLSAANAPRYFIATLMRTGAIQGELLKPLDFHLHVFARSCGQAASQLLWQAPIILFAVLALGVGAPASLAHAALFVVSVLLAFLVGFGINFLIGLISVFSIEINHISWFYYAITGFFSGQYVPIWMFPPLLARIVSLLPFQALIGIPMSIYIGRLSLPEALQAMALQAAWALALGLLGRFVWQRGYQRLVVQGG
jgi:ABC-2 type transport system permease protein